MTDPPRLNADFRDILEALGEQGADFVVVGAYAMAAHGVPRATGDIDILVRPDLGNGRRVLAALREFGAPVDDHGLVPEDLAKPGVVYQVGIPPRRIDILTRIDGVDFDRAWEERMDVVIDGLPIAFLGRATLIANKRASGREKDREDVRLLEQEPA